MTEKLQPEKAQNTDNASVKIPPPFVVAFWLLAGLYLNAEMAFSFYGPALIWRVLGAGIFTISLGVFLWSALSFKRNKTSIQPDKPSTHLMTGGIFGRSRNPIYLAFLAAFTGITCALDAPLALMFLPVVFLYLRWRVIAKEEAYLTRRFGSLYTAYKSRVRRWL